jgi:hypothetical protein
MKEGNPMNKSLKYALLLTAILALTGLAACGDDDDNNPVTPPAAKAWVGKWISAEGDVAPVLVAFSGYDSVYVTLNADNTIVLETHSDVENWVVTNGTYGVTKSATGNIHTINVTYPTYEQEGIVQIFAASPDSLWMEVVPINAGLNIPTPTNGFGSDPAWGVTNIQVYRRVN